MPNKALIFSLLASAAAASFAQGRTGLLEGTELNIELSGTVSNGDNAPLWLSSNKHGLVSPYDNSAYERVSLSRDLSTDSLTEWKVGYGIDLQLCQNAQSNIFLHQAYAQLGWKKALLSVGAKERTIDLRNDELSSGGLSQGVNARPIPEALLEIDYFSIPYTDHWWKWKGRIGFGMTTDKGWQKDWVNDVNENKYTTNTLYHEKALYWKLGREDKFPLTYQIGIQMMCVFGGTAYNVLGRGVSGTIENPTDLNAFWHAFWPMGSSDETDGAYKNAAGNTLGSYNMRLQWDDPSGWSVAGYFERFYEDHSMLTVQYGIYDHLIGVEAKLPNNKFINHILIEHISTKDQSGAVYHDPTSNLPDAIAGRDNYYNHQILSGWQHWGMAIGNPLITSPIYNDNHDLAFYNNRIQAWHIGIDGVPSSSIHWKALATFSNGWGTYAKPFEDIAHDQHYLAEATYKPQSLKGTSATLSLGLSHSKAIGNTFGGQLTIRKSLNL